MRQPENKPSRVYRSVQNRHRTEIQPKEPIVALPEITNAIKEIQKHCPQELEEVLYYIYNESCMPTPDLSVPNDEIIKMFWAKQGVGLIYLKLVGILGGQNGSKEKE